VIEPLHSFNQKPKGYNCPKPRHVTKIKQDRNKIRDKKIRIKKKTEFNEA